LPPGTPREAAPRLYRQRDPTASPLYRLVVEHFAGLKASYPERFEKTYGPWQGHWDRVIEKFLSCGDLSYGFARVWCDTCRHTYLRAFTCSARGLCPSCEARRRALWAEHVVTNVLPPDLPYRMAVFTIPRCLRPTFMRERRLAGDLSREAYECTRSFLSEQCGAEGVPYFVSVIQWFGDLGNAHVHVHAIVSLGVKDTGGAFHPVPEDLDFSPLEEKFRHAVLDMLVRKQRLTEESREALRSWEHSGFSVNLDVAAPPGDTEGLERIACYLLKPPLSLQRMTYTSGAPVVLYQGRFNPSHGANFVALDPKEFLVRLLVLVPQPYEALIRYYGAASSTARRRSHKARGQGEEHAEADPLLPEAAGAVEADAPSEGCSSPWARLLAKTYRVDPLRCPVCGGRLRVISVIHDPEVIERILRHIGRWDPPRGPPGEPPARERTIEYEPVPEYEDF
jgi:hypothetical protein